MTLKKKDSNTLRRCKYQIEVQAMLISMKTALDRLVALFSYYYKGISTHTTFGRLKENGKYRGFMTTCEQGKESDILLKYIYDEYFDWIKIVIAPRDMIIHYNDLGLIYQFNSQLNIEIPNHFNQRLINQKKDSKAEVEVYSFENLKAFGDAWYSFLIKVLTDLLKKDVTYLKERI